MECFFAYLAFTPCNLRDKYMAQAWKVCRTGYMNLYKHRHT